MLKCNVYSYSPGVEDHLNEIIQNTVFSVVVVVQRHAKDIFC